MKKGFVASAFDMAVHLGHLKMLDEARLQCDELVIALHINPSGERSNKRSPVPTVSERYLTIRQIYPLENVEIIPYETEAELYQLLKIIKPDIRFLGDDYQDKDYTGKDLDIPVYWIDRSHGLSSSRLREMARHG